MIVQVSTSWSDDSFAVTQIQSKTDHVTLKTKKNVILSGADNNWSCIPGDAYLYSNCFTKAVAINSRGLEFIPFPLCIFASLCSVGL